MKKLLFGTILLALVSVFPITTMAAVDISVNISLPPPIVFQAPPDVIVMPDTDDVYVVPDIDVDMFFWNGWWWRLWEGRWYRSQYYDRGERLGRPDREQTTGRLFPWQRRDATVGQSSTTESIGPSHFLLSG